MEGLNYEGQFYEIIISLGHQLRRCCLKIFLFLAVAANLLDREEALCNFIETNEKHWCKIILNFGEQ